MCDVFDKHVLLPMLYAGLFCLKLCGILVCSDGLDLYAGILACLDGYMNIAMEQTEEYVNGQLKNKYGDAFIRGNNGNNVFKISEVLVISLLTWTDAYW